MEKADRRTFSAFQHPTHRSARLGRPDRSSFYLAQAITPDCPKACHVASAFRIGDFLPSSPSRILMDNYTRRKACFDDFRRTSDSRAFPMRQNEAKAYQDHSSSSCAGRYSYRPVEPHPYLGPTIFARSPGSNWANFHMRLCPSVTTQWTQL